MTNRDLYLFVAALPKATCSLEEFLRALWQAGRARRPQAPASPGCAALPEGVRSRSADALAPADFAAMLETAFREPPPPYERAWERERAERIERRGYDHWDHVIRAQIVDLRQMAEAGTLADEMRYFGVNAPSGARWYNFDPNTYLECAMAGTYGGWVEGDDTGRDYVPGNVAVFHEDGTVTSEDPRSLEDPIVPLEPITWDAFADFLWCGQSYE